MRRFSKSWIQIGRWTGLISVVLCLAAWLSVGIFEARSVVGTWPFQLLLSLLIIITAVRTAWHRLMLLAVMNFAICGLLVLLVYLLKWTPSQAEAPFLLVGTVYFPLYTWTYAKALKHPPPLDPSRCANCNYSLRQLTEPRCPECGKQFEPSQIEMFNA